MELISCALGCVHCSIFSQQNFTHNRASRAAWVRANWVEISETSSHRLRSLSLWVRGKGVRTNYNEKMNSFGIVARIALFLKGEAQEPHVVWGDVIDFTDNCWLFELGGEKKVNWTFRIRGREWEVWCKCSLATSLSREKRANIYEQSGLFAFDIKSTGPMTHCWSPRRNQTNIFLALKLSGKLIKCFCNICHKVHACKQEREKYVNFNFN